MLALFVTAFGFGLAFCLSPGPVFAESLRRGLSGGFRPAFVVQIGSLVGDIAWALAAFAGLGALFALPWIRTPIEIAGALYLLWLAGASLRDARSPALPGVDAGTHRETGALLAGAAISLGNPKNIPFWLAIGSAMGGLGIPSPLSPEAAIFLAGFVVACLAACFLSAGAVAWLHRRLTPGLFAGLNLVCGLALIGFAALILVPMAMGG